MRSAQDMYEAFPAAVRASFPLYIRSAGPQVQLGPASAPADVTRMPCHWDQCTMRVSRPAAEGAEE